MLNWFKKQDLEIKSHKVYLTMINNYSKNHYELVLYSHIPLPFVDNLDFFPHWIELSLNSLELKELGLNLNRSNYSNLKLPPIPIEEIKNIDLSQAKTTEQLPVKEAMLVATKINDTIKQTILLYSHPLLKDSIVQFFDTLEVVGRYKGLGVYPCSIANFWYYHDSFFQLFDESKHPKEHSLLLEMYSLCRIS
jgi:hypothetical protein